MTMSRFADEREMMRAVAEAIDGVRADNLALARRQLRRQPQLQLQTRKKTKKKTKKKEKKAIRKKVKKENVSTERWLEL
ncbi:MAG: hypothetical protein Q8K86_07010 [Candidatus Nanopelagicaceae bacterium]|nr:hypothetical protein [Candidatus Nanopelagicaceae bacterium]